MMRGRAACGLLSFALGTMACGDESDLGSGAPVCAFGRGAEVNESCSLGQELGFVAGVLADQYFYADRIGPLTPDYYLGFDSPSALLRDVRQSIAPADRFSFIADREANDLANQGVFAGFGYRSVWTEEREVMVMRVFGTHPPEDPTPASEQGLVRGDIIYGIDGVLFADATDEELSDLFGPSDVGVTRTLMVRAQDGSTRELTMSKREITRHTVPITKVFERNGESIGYVLFESFLPKSREELDDSFRVLQDAAPTTVILDLRYNGGGRQSIGAHLANLLIGESLAGATRSTLEFNNRYGHCNVSFEFETAARGIVGLRRLIIITGRGTASASENVWNQMRAFVEVVTVGEQTVGKSTGFFPYQFCGKVLFPVNYQAVNANGEITPFDGVVPTCLAPDDLTSPLGDPTEGQLAAALAMAEGRCPQALTVAGPRLVFRDDLDLHLR